MNPLLFNFIPVRDRVGKGREGGREKERKRERERERERERGRRRGKGREREGEKEREREKERGRGRGRGRGKEMRDLRGRIYLSVCAHVNLLCAVCSNVCVKKSLCVCLYKAC